eukprot:scaffold268869_cov36-Prasinocladus_malaysianus.AAC.1
MQSRLSISSGLKFALCGGLRGAKTRYYQLAIRLSQGGAQHTWESRRGGTKIRPGRPWTQLICERSDCYSPVASTLSVVFLTVGSRSGPDGFVGEIQRTGPLACPRLTWVPVPPSATR